MSELSRIVDLMEDRGVASQRDLVGVPDHEIVRLEEHFGVFFPDVYRSFLMTFGRSAGLLTPWMALYFDDLKEIHDLYLQFRQTRGRESGFTFSLPAKALLIANFESVFDFILCEKAANPAVFRIDFSDKVMRQKPIAANFTAYLEYLVNTSETGEIHDESFDYLLTGTRDDMIHY